MSKDQDTQTKNRLEKGHCPARHCCVGVVGWPCTAHVDVIPSDSQGSSCSAELRLTDLSEISGSLGEHTGRSVGEGRMKGDGSQVL